MEKQFQQPKSRANDLGEFLREELNQKQSYNNNPRKTYQKRFSINFKRKTSN